MIGVTVLCVALEWATSLSTHFKIVRSVNLASNVLSLTAARHQALGFKLTSFQRTRSNLWRVGLRRWEFSSKTTY